MEQLGSKDEIYTVYLAGYGFKALEFCVERHTAHDATCIR
jgi:hypothetical protein